LILSARYLRIAVLEHRHELARIDGLECRLQVLAGHQVDQLVIESDSMVQREQHDRTTGGRHRVVIELDRESPRQRHNGVSDV